MGIDCRAAAAILLKNILFVLAVCKAAFYFDY